MTLNRDVCAHQPKLGRMRSFNNNAKFKATTCGPIDYMLRKIEIKQKQRMRRNQEKMTQHFSSKSIKFVKKDEIHNHPRISTIEERDIMKERQRKMGEEY